MSQSIDRRRFMEMGAATSAALGVAAAASAAEDNTSPNEKIVVAVMGVNGRGRALARSFAQQKGAEVGYVCDVDERAIPKGQAAVEGYQSKKPKGVKDFRSILDDKSIDVLVVAAPNHWHAPATILGCSAGKHVYVEKPCCHNPNEGELAVKAARKYNRVVTQGTQRRSRPSIIEGMKRLHDGEIGKIHYARTWYNSRRPGIGTGKKSDVPSWLDYSLWQGPAPEQPYIDNLVHYNWHWRWHWGNGELGNNGIHSLDLARWGMDVDYPIRVTSAGGRYRWEDDQQTNDTHMVCFEYEGGGMITWEGLSWSSMGANWPGMCTFHGEKGHMLITDSGYKLYDLRNKELESNTGPGGEANHLDNFLGCIRNGGRPNADIEIGHQSTLLCHLGNIAQRTGRTLNTNPKNGHILGDKAAMDLWGREYQQGWEPKV